MGSAKAGLLGCRCPKTIVFRGGWLGCQVLFTESTTGFRHFGPTSLHQQGVCEAQGPSRARHLRLLRQMRDGRGCNSTGAGEAKAPGLTTARSGRTSIRSSSAATGTASQVDPSEALGIQLTMAWSHGGSIFRSPPN